MPRWCQPPSPCWPTDRLLPEDSDSLAWLLHLLSLLHERAEVAEEDHQQVLAAPARYPRTLADFPAHAEQRHDVGQRDEVDQAAEEAGVPYGLRVLAERVARHEVGNDAQAQVVETAADAVFPGHGW